MAKIRLSQRNQKQANFSQAAKREIAELLQNGKLSRAEIKTESIVREDYVMEANEIIIDFLEMCIARIQVINKESVCPPSLLMHISTIIWAANYMEGDDFIKIKEDLTLKYGKKFVEEATLNSLGQANPKVVSRLSMMVPEKKIVKKYLREIANQFNVDYEDPDEILPELPSVPTSGGGSGPSGGNVAYVPPPPPTYIPGITQTGPQYPSLNTTQVGGPGQYQPPGMVPPPGQQPVLPPQNITQQSPSSSKSPKEKTSDGRDAFEDEFDLDDIAKRLNDLN